MSQELLDLLIIATATLGAGPGLIIALSGNTSYRDTMMYYSQTDRTRQKALGKPQFSEVLKEDLSGLMRTMVGKEYVSSYQMKYFSAYLESEMERENNKFIGYRKIRE